MKNKKSNICHNETETISSTISDISSLVKAETDKLSMNNEDFSRIMHLDKNKVNNIVSCGNCDTYTLIKLLYRMGYKIELTPIERR